MEKEVLDIIQAPKLLSEEQEKILEKQNSRPLSEYRIDKLEKDAQKHWDLFYKRNCDRFFKNRYWTMKEFEELHDLRRSEKHILEVGCGVGNLIYPLLEEHLFKKIYACDFSSRAIELVKSNARYNPSVITAFQADVTQTDSLAAITKESIDVVTMVFVMSAINPKKFKTVIQNILPTLKPGAIVFFRDYGIYDMTQLRFKPGNKIAEQYYVRQDGTKSYFFTVEEIRSLFINEGFIELNNVYVHRRTINRKESIDVPRVFIQAKFKFKKNI